MMISKSKIRLLSKVVLSRRGYKKTRQPLIWTTVSENTYRSINGLQACRWRCTLAYLHLNCTRIFLAGFEICIFVFKVTEVVDVGTIRCPCQLNLYDTAHWPSTLPYWSSAVGYHKSSVSTRSFTSQFLAIPRHKLSVGCRSFSVSAPKIWNSLTPQIRQCQTLATFRRHLKDPLLSVSLFCHLASITLCALILWDFGAL